MSRKFKNLVFEGGGVKGIAYAGALEILEKEDILSNVTRVAGASAGAITALPLALGYSAKELKKIITSVDFASFSDDTFGFIRDIIRLVKQYGWNKGDRLLDWFGNLIEEKTGTKDLTFAQLHELTKTKGMKDLYVIGFNLTQGIPEIYSYETTPNMRIRYATRISMSIPFYFQAMRRKGQVLVDGGVTWNYPITLFDHARYLSNSKNGEKKRGQTNDKIILNHETLGFRLGSDKKYLQLEPGTKPQKIQKPLRNIKDYAQNLLTFMLETANQQYISNKDWNRTVYINIGDVKTTDFKLSDSKVDWLVNEGQKGVKKHFKWRDGPKGVKKPV
tara:strand:- start:161 stop:1156 length:996 start_codon:yes stop_codon:yes gene_type:complete